MQYIFYFFIAIVATSVGALTGMGGGIIIKPILDAMGGEAAYIGLISSTTVFSMAVVSAIKHIRHHTKLDINLAISAASGSALGGIVGNKLLAIIIFALSNNRLVVAIQNMCLAFLIIAILVYLNKKERQISLNIVGAFPALLIGVVLGIISSFLGIGGGPLNVALFIYCFGCGIKSATAYSIIVILFSQTSKLALEVINRNFLLYDMSMLPAMIVGAIFGGWIGSHFNNILSQASVRKFFRGTQVMVLLICLYNIFINLML